MRRIQLPGLDVEVSSLGFGCASLGSRVAPAAGLKALASAFDAGVTWFDVAPAYGGGAAEGLLGDFVQGRRGDIQICTKVGLRAPRRNIVYRTVLPMARRILSAAPGLRAAAKSGARTVNQAVPLTAGMIADSIADSLVKLKTDHVDVLALHMADPAVIGRDDILRALEQILARGQARAVGVAGTAEAAVLTAALGKPYGVVQLADDPETRPLARVRDAAAGRPLSVITHSVFGVDGAFARARARLLEDEPRRRRLAEMGYEGEPDRITAEILLDRALASNADGVVLMSMFGADHLRFNVSRAARAPSATALEAAAALFA